MDIDLDPVLTATASASSSNNRQSLTVHPVDDAHPFDLDSYISSYTGQLIDYKYSQKN